MYLSSKYSILSEFLCNIYHSLMLKIKIKDPINYARLQNTNK